MSIIILSAREVLLVYNSCARASKGFERLIDNESIGELKVHDELSSEVLLLFLSEIFLGAESDLERVLVDGSVRNIIGAVVTAAAGGEEGQAPAQAAQVQARTARVVLDEQDDITVRSSHKKKKKNTSRL